MDIWFLIDGSGSIGRRKFETTLQFVVDLASEFPISSNGVRAGFSVYSSSHKIHSFFDEHNSNSSFSNLALSSPYTGGKSGHATCVANHSNEMTKFSKMLVYFDKHLGSSRKNK